MNMKTKSSTVALVLLLAAAWLAGCGGPADTGDEAEQARAEAPEEALARARSAADELTSELKQRLASGMATGGPPAAIEVCSQAAPEIAAAHSTGGVAVRRVSMKARNPNDRPDPWEETQLTLLEQRHASGDMPEEVWEVVDTADGKTLRYLRPIEVGPMCLNCHGDPSTMSSAVVEKIRNLYPHDQAVGYETGDLRGAVSVSVELSPGA